MLNIILLVLIFGGLAFGGWKFLAANKKENISALILAGANSGIEPLIGLLKDEKIAPALNAGWEYTLRYFFQKLGRAQYEQFTQQLNLPALGKDVLNILDERASSTIMRYTQPADANALAPLHSNLTAVAEKFTTDVAKTQKENQTNAQNMEACTLPIVGSVSKELGNLIFTPKGYKENKTAFDAILTNALQATAEQVFKSVSGKDDGGRYLGGGCC